MHLKLTYTRKDFEEILIGFVDADWGGQDAQNRNSTSGYIFKMFQNCTITWRTKRQTSVAASSTEAEYMALYEAAREAMWLRSLAESINLKIINPIVIYEDNMGCIAIANNPTNHDRTKHINIKYHFSRDQIEKHVIKLEYVCTGKQIADTLTKPLLRHKFQEFRIGLGS